MDKYALLFHSVVVAVFGQAGLPNSHVHNFTATLDNTPTTTIVGYYDGVRTMVSLDSYARAARFQFIHRGHAYIIVDDGDRYAFTPPSNDVLFNNEIANQLSTPLVLKNNLVFASLDDLSHIFSESIDAQPTKISIHTTGNENFTVAVEPTPFRPTTNSVNFDSSSGSAHFSRIAHPINDTVDALVVRLSTSYYDATRISDLAFSTNGQYFQGSIDTVRYNQASPQTTGVLAFEKGSNRYTLGYEDNILSGFFFNGPGGVGMSYASPHLIYAYYHTPYGQTVAMVAHHMGNFSTYYGILKNNGTVTPLVGTRKTNVNHITTTQEYWATPTGIGYSFDAVTQGRLFGEMRISHVLGSMPLAIGDAPSSLNLGYRLTPGLTVSAGLVAGYHLRPSLFVGLNGRISRNLAASAFIANQNKDVDFEYTQPTLSLSASYDTSINATPTMDIDGQILRKSRVYTFHALHNTSNEDDTFVSEPQQGPGLILGYEHLRSNAQTNNGPIVGFTVPLGKAFAIDLAQHPSLTGRNLQIGLTARFAFPSVIPTRTITLTDCLHARIYLDDHQTGTCEKTPMPYGIPYGEHLLQARSIDGLFASLYFSVTPSVMMVSLPLYPVKAIEGKVMILHQDPLLPIPSLAHLTLVMDPENVTTETNDDGTFTFPEAPITPNSRISILLDSVPETLTPGDDVPTSLTPLVLTLLPRQNVHKTIFHQ